MNLILFKVVHMQLLPKEYRNPETLKQAVRNLQQELDDAEKIADPAGRLVAALDVERSINHHVSSIGERLGERGSNLAAAFYLSTALGGTVLGLAVAALSAPIGFTIMGVGIAIGVTSLVTDFFPNKMRSLVSTWFKGHLEELDPVAIKTSQLVDLTLKTKTAEIAASEKFDSVYDDYPEVRDHFIKTFNKAVAKADIPAQEPTTPPPAAKPKLAL